MRCSPGLDHTELYYSSRAQVGEPKSPDLVGDQLTYDKSSACSRFLKDVQHLQECETKKIAHAVLLE